MSNACKNETPLLLTCRQAYELAGISKSKWFGLIASGKTPPALRCGRSRRYRRADMERWIEWGLPNAEKFAELKKQQGGC